jgi:hypothetical protein
MADTIIEIRRLLEQTRPSAASIGYPLSVREHVGSWARDLQHAGHALSPIASDLGISRTTLRVWADAVETPTGCGSMRPELLRGSRAPRAEIA